MHMKRVIVAGCSAALFFAAVLYVYYSVLPSDQDCAVYGEAPDGFARGPSCVGRWYRPQDRNKITGVALVVHGLNVRPERMEPVIAALNKAGIEALNISLCGHGDPVSSEDPQDTRRGRLQALMRVTYSLWLDELYQAYVRACARANKIKVPVFFVGNSLGGLLGCSLLAARPEVHFQKMALFAPALSLHRVISLYLAMLEPFPALVIDSDAAESHRANDGIPISGYTALLEGIGNLDVFAGPKLNVPTLLFVDRKDEFVSFEQLQGFIAAHGLAAWELSEIEKDAGIQAPHHMILNEQSVGPQMWDRMVRRLQEHFTGKAPAQ